MGPFGLTALLLFYKSIVSKMIRSAHFGHDYFVLDVTKKSHLKCKVLFK